MSSSPIHSGSSLSGEAGSESYPEGHSHVYDSPVLLQVLFERQRYGDWHTSSSVANTSKHVTVPNVKVTGSQHM